MNATTYIYIYVIDYNYMLEHKKKL